MTGDMPKHNFYAGPSILPSEAIAAAIEGLRDFAGTGLPVVSVSHRSAEWQQVMDEAEAVVRRLLNVPENYHVLFLQGGARQQFAQVPYNFLPADGRAAYLDTGTWAGKAIAEARLFGTVDVVASGKDRHYRAIPKDFTIPEDAAYFHCTSNNTIYGTQMKAFPESPVPMVCDMSSDIFSRPLDVEKFAVIYAGAQKNMGPAGTTLVIIRDDMPVAGRPIPEIWDYRKQAAKGSMLNTPPVFAIYLSYLTMRWMEAQGGVAEMQRRNEAKAALLYAEIDRNPLFEGTAAPEDRSVMNVTFVLRRPELETEFLKMAAEADIVGIKGHRSVGGFRASCYNALPKESVEVLVDVMRAFAEKYA